MISDDIVLCQPIWVQLPHQLQTITVKGYSLECISIPHVMLNEEPLTYACMTSQLFHSATI